MAFQKISEIIKATNVVDRYPKLKECVRNCNVKITMDHFEVGSSAVRTRVMTNNMIDGGNFHSVIFDYNTWDILCVTPRYSYFYDEVNKTQFEQKIINGDYNYYHLNDGTIVTMYKWLDITGVKQWGIATKTSYDVSTMVWAGTKSFAQVIYEVFTQYPEFIKTTGATYNKQTGFIEFSNISEDIQYFSFGFHHSDYHPTREQNSLWAIDANYFDLPEQMELSNFTKGTYSEFVKAIGSDNVKYGLICKDKNNSSMDVIIHTPLMIRIQRMLYTFPKDKVKRDAIIHVNRWFYQIIASIIVCEQSKMKIILRPDLKLVVDEICEFFSKVCDHIIDLITSKAMPHCLERQTAIRFVARGTLYKISPLHKDIKKIVYDQLVCMDNIIFLLNEFEFVHARIN